MAVHPSLAIIGGYAASFLYRLHHGVASLTCTLPRGQDVQVIEERKEPLGSTECGRGLSQSGRMAKGEQRRSQRVSLFAPLSVHDIAAMPRIVPPAVCGRTTIKNLTKGKSSGATDFSAGNKKVREIVSCAHPPSGLLRAVSPARAEGYSWHDVCGLLRICQPCLRHMRKTGWSWSRIFKCFAGMPVNPALPPRFASRKAAATAFGPSWRRPLGQRSVTSDGTAMRGRGGRRAGSVHQIAHPRDADSTSSG